MSIINLSQDEKIEKVVRKHWLVLLLDSFGLIILYIAPFIVYWYFVEKFYTNQSPSVLIFIVSIWTLFAWIKLFAIWTDYYLDIWIITNKRIVDIEQKGFFNRDISTFRMERIQDVTVAINGIIATLLDFGDIHVQTAGESQKFIIKGIAHPKQIKELIMRTSDNVVR
jgi:membrane protein YdbS with pleckstrin-like domain